MNNIPDTMKAYIIRQNRFGPPMDSMKLEHITTPSIEHNEVLVQVYGSGINYNGIWAASGKPVDVMKARGEDFHIAGSDASGVVVKTGDAVKRWTVGDEVIIHCNQSCGQCGNCLGFDPLACDDQKIWGYETNWGSFSQYTKVQSQQLLRKPPHLGWAESASYALTFFTAYRMLISKAQVKPNDNVLIWGAAGGLGVFAIQLCQLVGAEPICVVSSDEKIDFLKTMNVSKIVDRRHVDLNEGRSASIKMGKKIRELTGGKDVNIVFEHVGSQTFNHSVFLAKKFGKIVICGATSGYDLKFDVRHLWMNQKEILGSHFANYHECEKANDLIISKKIHPVCTKTFSFDKIPEAHQYMADNNHYGNRAVDHTGSFSL